MSVTRYAIGTLESGFPGMVEDGTGLFVKFADYLALCNKFIETTDAIVACTTSGTTFIEGALKR